MRKLSWKEVLEIVRAAREKDERPDLRGVDLAGVDLSYTDLSHADLTEANLSGADLGRADLSGANLGRADLSGANLSGTNLRLADLSQADLDQANLSYSDLYQVNLSGANLGGATIFVADLSRAVLSRADLSGAGLGQITFVNTALDDVKGLETVEHYAPSFIDTYTLFDPGNHLPEVFLRGAGVPEALITYLPSLTGQAIQYYSCFISYSVKDTPFATRLHNDLQAKGVRCWYAPEDEVTPV